MNRRISRRRCFLGRAPFGVALVVPLLCCQPDFAVDEPIPGWTLAGQPDLRIGLVEGDSAYLFSNIKGVLQLANGTIVVADAGSDQLRYFDPEGQFMLYAGREGDGPGEFQGISWINECSANSVYVYDFVLARVSVFDENGTLVETFRIGSPEGTLPAIVKCQLGADFVVVGRTGGIGAEAEGPYRLEQPVTVADSRGAIAKTLVVSPGSERYRYPTSSGPRPLGKKLVVGIFGGLVFVGSGDTYAIDVFTLGGKKLPGIDRAVQPQNLTPEKLERIISASVDRAPAARREALRKWLDELEYPKHLPLYTDLMTDSEGNLWVQQYTFPDDESTVWDVFEYETWRHLGMVSIPARFTLFSIGSDFAIGKSVAPELDVEIVERYALLKALDVNSR